MNRLTRVLESQMLTGNLEFYHLATPVSLVPTANRDTQVEEYYSQARVWERIIEVVRTVANVVIVGPLESTGFSFAVEHSGAIQPDYMQDALRELGTVAFSASDTSKTVDLKGVVLTRLNGFRLDTRNTGQGTVTDYGSVWFPNTIPALLSLDYGTEAQKIKGNRRPVGTPDSAPRTYAEQLEFEADQESTPTTPTTPTTPSGSATPTDTKGTK